MKNVVLIKECFDVIKYLVKFVAKESYADDLLNGKLFMHCAKYYHDLEKKNGPGQGDIREGSIIPNVAMYRNIYLPIFCMYMIKDEDIRDGQVIIDKRVIQDFKCQQGYMVIIPFEYFKRVLLPTVDTGGYQIVGDEVMYGVPQKEVIDRMFTNKDALNLLVKNPFFRYQREYRLIVFKNLYRDNFSESLQEERTLTCCFTKPKVDIVKKKPISFLRESNEGLVLDILDVLNENKDTLNTQI